MKEVVNIVMFLRSYAAVVEIAANVLVIFLNRVESTNHNEISAKIDQP